MQKFDVQIALEGIREARSKWAAAQSKFNADVEVLLMRLLNEAAVNFMSAEEVAKASGLTVKRVRILMRKHGLNPKVGKRLLAQRAAETLAENAALLGIDPHEMDLMSPLAYLPMGQEMRKFLETKTVSQVHELPDETAVERLTEVFKAAWHSRDAYWRSAPGTGADSQSDRTQAGIRAVLAELGICPCGGSLPCMTCGSGL